MKKQLSMHILNIDMHLQIMMKMLRFEMFLYSWSLYVKEIKCRLSLLKQFSIKVWHAYQLHQNELISFTLFFVAVFCLTTKTVEEGTGLIC